MKILYKTIWQITGIASILLSIYLPTYGQVANSNCQDAITLPAGNNWCSEVGAYTNVGANSSGFGIPTCWPSASNDVWFSFISVGTDVTITINGTTLNTPEVALYTGNCVGTINEQQCETAFLGNAIDLYKGGLVIGQTYLIRVQGRLAASGSFQICINNYNAPADPGSDCVTASVLCDKSPFVVQSVTSAGNDTDEAGNSSCLGGLGGSSESNSTWFHWTCESAGTLTFVLSPNNPSDDLDFVVYRLPGGLNDCTNKTEVRCMASSCEGITGLSSSSNDISEQPNCPAGHDNFVAELDMLPGETYALMINNFSATGNGFSINFGGTGTFQGPMADFNVSTDFGCAGEDFIFSDNSTFAYGNITAWSWNFGLDAQPADANTQGAHEVSYNSAGEKSVSLTIETDFGCIVTAVDLLNIDSCCQTHNAIEYTSTSTDVICRGEATGGINLAVNPSLLPLTYTWSNGVETAQNANIEQGTYMVTVSNVLCQAMDTFLVNGPPVWSVEANITKPTCDGGVDGAIDLVTIDGSNGSPYLFNWDNNGFSNSMSFDDLSNGVYNLLVQDALGCDTSIDYVVNELILELDSVWMQMIHPSCYTYSDGSIQVEVANGLAPYTYAWANGSNNSFLDSLTDGTYVLNEIMDANRCRGGAFTFELEEPALLEMAIDAFGVSCFGFTNGLALVSASGGTAPYFYTWEGNVSSDSIAEGLAPGTYLLTVTDLQNCKAYDSTSIAEPSPLLIDSVYLQNASCNGYWDGIIEIFASGGSSTTGLYTYTTRVNQLAYNPSNLFEKPAGTYTIGVMDDSSCVASQEVEIGEPAEFFVYAGEDQEVELGDHFNVYANMSFVDYYDYEWSGEGNIECPYCRGTEIQPVEDGSYVIKIANEKGCWDTDTMNVVVDKNYEVFIPNAFSPNGDGNNDYLQVFSKHTRVQKIKQYQIYDRWGELIFNAKDIPLQWAEYTWDGTYKGEDMPMGVYVYIIDVAFIDGYVQRYIGDVSLLR